MSVELAAVLAAILFVAVYIPIFWGMTDKSSWRSDIYETFYLDMRDAIKARKRRDNEPAPAEKPHILIQWARHGTEPYKTNARDTLDSLGVEWRDEPEADDD